MYKAIIVEDEELARNLLKNFLKDVSDIELIGEYDNGFTGLKAINDLKPDLVFLDVQMPKLTGFELLELLDELPLIIFTTAYEEYAIKAFEINAVDYLLKPFSKDRFITARMKIEPETKPEDQLKEHIETSKVLDKIVVKDNNKIHVIPLDEIQYLEAQDDYVMIHTTKGKYLKNQTMHYYEEHLDPSKFVRIHRSYIVNLNSMDRIEKYGKDTYTVVRLKDGASLRISRSRYNELKEHLNF